MVILQNFLIQIFCLDENIKSKNRLISKFSKKINLKVSQI